VPLHEAEMAMWGFTHAEVGAFLLGLWGLPINVVDAVAHHHNSPSLGHHHIEISDAVYAARVQIQLGSELSLDPFDRVPACPREWLEDTGLASMVDFSVG
jgi:HD-like signal output (HDOD) protein